MPDDGPLVLLVDDDETIRRAFARLLERAGVATLTAAGGEEALTLCRERRPDVVLLDQRMPGLSGLEVLTRIRSEMPRVQVVMVTGEGTLETAIEALRAGAWDFVTKPVRSGELLCRVVDRALERAELLRENERQRKRLLSLNEELTRAVEELRDDQLAGRTLQRQLLPPERAELAPFNVEHRLFASRYLSGDFVDYFPLGDERVGFYVADVAGHGAASAFVTAMVSALVGGYREAYGAGRDDTVVHPARLLARLNGDLLARRMEKHVCLFYGVLSRTAPRVTYSSAGFFPYPMLHRAQGGLEMLELPSVPLALFPDSEYVAAERTFGPGDALLVASDGVAEDATQAQSERLGQVARAFMESQELDELAARLALGEAAVGERALTDDVTLFLCRRGWPVTTEVLHAQDGGAHVLRYRGEVRYPATPAVARFVREMIDRDAPSALVIDLTDVSIIDSTNLGHIARVGQELRARGADFVIVSPNEDVTEVLRSMAFDRVFAVVTDPPPAAGEDGDGAGVETERVPLGGRANAAELKETVLEAHRCLLDLSEDNRVLFEEVVSMLEACEQKRKTQAE